MWFKIVKRLTREQMVKDTNLLRTMLREYLKPEDVRDADKKRELYQRMNWKMGEYSWDEYYFIMDMISTHSHGNENAERFLEDFTHNNKNNHSDFNRRLNNTMSHFVTMVTEIPEPKSPEEQRRLKEQEQQRIAQSRQRPPSRKKGQRKRKNTNPKGGGGGRRGKQRDIDRSSRAYDKYKERKRNDQKTFR